MFTYRTVNSGEILVPNNVPVENFKYVWDTGRRKRRRQKVAWRRIFQSTDGRCSRCLAAAALGAAVITIALVVIAFYFLSAQLRSGDDHLLVNNRHEPLDRNKTEKLQLLGYEKNDDNKMSSLPGCPDLCSTARDPVCGSDGVTVSGPIWFIS